MCLRDDFRLFTEQLTAGERKGPRLSRIVSQTFIHSAGRAARRPAPFKRALIRDRHGKRLTFSNTGNLVSVGTYGFKIADYELTLYVSLLKEALDSLSTGINAQTNRVLRHSLSANRFDLEPVY